MIFDRGLYLFREATNSFHHIDLADSKQLQETQR